jgi:hypothetical protein
VHFSYRRYLENRLRDAFGFDGTPLRLVFRDRRRVELERHRRRAARAGPPPGARAPRASSKGHARTAKRDPNGPMTRPTAAVVGAGAWGTTLASNWRGGAR